MERLYKIRKVDWEKDPKHSWVTSGPVSDFGELQFWLYDEWGSCRFSKNWLSRPEISRFVNNDEFEIVGEDQVDINYGRGKTFI